MRDVAALAGVAVGTVSNALNAPQRVAPQTRRRVQAAIAELGWVRNESARQLRAGSSMAIGIVVMDIGNPFFTDVIAGVEEFCYDRGLSVHVGNSDQRPDRQDMLLRRLEEQRVRGVILAPIGQRGDVAGIAPRTTPVVLVDRVHDPNHCCVGVDDVSGGRLAARHLLDHGHRRIAFAGKLGAFAQADDRWRGAAQAVEGVAGSALRVVETPAHNIESGVDSAVWLAALPPDERPTAVFAANDLIAIGLLQGFTTAGLAVPGDIAIIGYDDISFAAAAAVPLSSIHQPRGQMGAEAAALLWKEIEDRQAGERHAHRTLVLQPHLVARRSTAA
ncbi:MAG: LacI family transcriptional regulator [Bifidobacteriaceae bacterium]|jgi:LacI family transcriptional regulator|nr:LacI family transcriptional regulator [Bifidobacteriaceae bacterium]